MKYYIVIPTYNGGEVWKQAADKIKIYSPCNSFIQVIDSGSTDNTVVIAREHGFSVLEISSNDFNHGGTRNLAVDMYKENYDIVIFLTQDAIPEPGFIDKIMNAFNDSSVACAYGRQLPHLNANEISRHARYFNYPEDSYISSKDDVSKMGIKTVFISNSFSAYRISTFVALGGFPDNTILSEDMYYAAKSVLSGARVAYVSDSVVRHSHNYSAAEEFRRYFDIGVFHADEPWIRAEFGGAGGEGKKYLISEFKYLFSNNRAQIFKSLLHNLAKISGYKLGQYYRCIPLFLVKKFSMHRRYWN